MNTTRAFFVAALRHRLSVACVIAAMTAVAVAPWVLARQPRIPAAEARTLQPLASGWRFVQDDAMTDEAAVASTGEGWEVVTLPHTWNAHDAASTNATVPYKRGRG